MYRILEEDRALFDSILLLNKSCIGMKYNKLNIHRYKQEVKHIIHLYNIHKGTTYDAENILANLHLISSKKNKLNKAQALEKLATNGSLEPHEWTAFRPQNGDE